MVFERSVTQVSSDNSWDGTVTDGSDQLFFVSSYSNFDKLAHGPRGTQAKHSIYVFQFNPTDGSMVLVNKAGKTANVVNPAFSRIHPRLNVVYTCTEDIEENGRILAYQMGPDGALELMGSVDAGGTSTCYLTIDRGQRNILAVNYWDSTLAVIPLDQQTGNFTGPIHSIYDPKQGQGMVSASKKHGGVNHSNNDESTIAARQADPHSHALVLDPYVGSVAYVPDLGKDLIREFWYDRRAASIQMQLNEMPSGLCTGKPDGPRYIDFHPQHNIAYVVNELSSTVAVFSIDRELLNEISAAAARNENMDRFRGRTSLRLIQSISTIPGAFPTEENTCGRICVHQGGQFVVVSNRGHESLAIFRVRKKGPFRGQLASVGHFHTRGETPRHFTFDASGQFLIVANQDTDSISVFAFNLSSGEIKYTGNEYRVPSPNFVCCCPTRDDADEDVALDLPLENLVVTAHKNSAESQTPLRNNTETSRTSDDTMRSTSPSSFVATPVETETDSDWDSDGSTIPVNAADAKSLRRELAKARRELLELRERLSGLE